MTDRELMQQALEALMDAQRHNYALKHKETDDLITALRERLAQPKQEPVAWIYSPLIGDGPKERRLTFVHPSAWGTQLGLEITPLYTAQPRQWQGLTGDEVNEFAAGCHLGNSVQGAIRKAEAKLREKNT